MGEQGFPKPEDLARWVASASAAVERMASEIAEMQAALVKAQERLSLLQRLADLDSPRRDEPPPTPDSIDNAADRAPSEPEALEEPAASDRVSGPPTTVFVRPSFDQPSE
jgi:hypothetical protein